MPKRWSRSVAVWAISATRLHDLADGAVEIAPVLALAHDRLEILLQHNTVLHRVLHDRAHKIRGEALRVDGARAEMAGLGPGADGHRDRLGGRERARGRLELELAVERL